MEWKWSADILKPLSTALARRTDAVPDDADKTTLPIIGKISFGGELTITEPDERVGYCGRLFWAERGDLIYSKIRVKQGSLCLVPADVERVAVSNEYPVFRVRKDAADADYIALLLKSNLFLQLLDGISHGGSSKTRIAPDEFGELGVPLPPLATQRAIVARWREAQARAAAAHARANDHEGTSLTEFTIALGFPAERKLIVPKCLAVRWSETSRWAVSFSQLDREACEVVTKSTYPVVLLETLAEVAYGIAKSPGNRPREHARPYLRVANVQRDRLDLREVKQINVPDDEFDSCRLQRGDLLVCEGNSPDLVGRPAIWNDEIPNCVHQNHLLRVRVRPDVLLPEFLLHYMSCYPARLYFRSRAKFTTNLASINSRDLRDLPVPLPPLAEQRALVARVAAARAEIARERAEAARLATAIAAETESLLLGTQTLAK